MRRPTTDPTAGERARAISADPGAPQPIVDPTDPRHRKPSTDPRPGNGESQVFDPTDPDNGRQPD